MKFLRIIWCDVTGIRRCRVVPLDDRITKLGEGDINIPIADYIHHISRLALVCYFLPCYADEVVTKKAQLMGDTRLQPSVSEISGMSKVVWLPYSPDAIVVSEMLSLSRFPGSDTAEHVQHDWSPRRYLQLALERLKRECLLDILVGFETEFILLQKIVDENGHDMYVPIETSAYCQTTGFDTVADVIRDMCTVLQDHGHQQVLHCHGESAHGQYEIVTGYGDAMTQADDFILRKELIQHVARNHGLVVSFLPKLFKNQAGTASHVHISLVPTSDTDRVELDDHGLSIHLSRFIAGLIDNMQALVLLTAGSPNSSKRLLDGAWAGSWSCWGFDNKEAPLRVIDRNHVEYKSFDGTVNPYLAITAILCAGLDGISRGQCAPGPVTGDPSVLDSKPVTCTRLPQSLDESILFFSENRTRMETDGSGMISEWYRAICSDGGIPKKDLDEFLHDFCATKEAEAEYFSSKSFEEEVDLLRLRY